MSKAAERSRRTSAESLRWSMASRRSFCISEEISFGGVELSIGRLKMADRRKRLKVRCDTIVNDFFQNF